MDKAERFFYDLGVEVAGPLLVGMVDWLAQRVRADGVDHVLFLARDGFILRQIWQMRVPDDLQAVPTTYLLASRRSLGFARIHELDLAAKRLLAFEKGETVPAYLKRLPFRVNVDKLHTDLGLPLAADAIMDDLLYGTILQALEPDILQAARAERAAYEAYLREIGILDATRIAVVDAGWYGSLQHALAQLPCLSKAALQGYYLGLFPQPEYLDRQGLVLSGWLINGDSGKRFEELVLMVQLLDFFCSVDQPGFVCMRMNPLQKPEPVFVSQTLSDFQKSAIEQLQLGVLEVAARAEVAPQESCPEALYAKLRSTGLMPNAREIEFLSRLQGVRGIDVSSTSTFAVRSHWGRYLFNWNTLYRDYKSALWRPGFWAQLSAWERFLLKVISPVGTKDFS